MDNGNNYYDNGHGQDINKQDPSVRQEKGTDIPSRLRDTGQ